MVTSKIYSTNRYHHHCYYTTIQLQHILLISNTCLWHY